MIDIVSSNFEGAAKSDEVGNNLTPFRYRVIIPLNVFPIFNSPLLAPSYLLAGTRLELLTHSREHFFQKATGWTANSRVTIEKPTLFLESYSLSDSVSRKLSQISASSSLEWSFVSLFNTVVLAGNTDVTISVTKSLSRANMIMMKTRHADDIRNGPADSFASQPWNYGPLGPVTLAGGILTAAYEVGNNGACDLQVQLGSLYTPSSPIPPLRHDHLHSILKTMSAFRRDDTTVGVGIGQFGGVKTKLSSDILVAAVDSYPVYLGSLACSAISLETSATLAESGSALSSQRTCVLNARWDSSPISKGTGLPALRRIDVFITHSKLVSLFLDTCVVRS